ncbi:hypothetical protein EDD21DRAFT_162920 [Dissophora ornata]|nr:hypothetical protein EDD21DRAFT_162920 [Dissophora ornata]
MLKPVCVCLFFLPSLRFFFLVSQGSYHSGHNYRITVSLSILEAVMAPGQAGENSSLAPHCGPSCYRRGHKTRQIAGG